MADRVWKAAGDTLEVRKHAIAPLVLESAQGGGEILVVVHASPSDGDRIRQSTLRNDKAFDSIHTFAALQIRKDERPRSAHSQRVRFHDLEIGPDQRSQIHFVYDQQVGARDARA